MTGRAKWDDFNNSAYDDEELDERRILDHCRLYITNIPKALNEDGLRAAFERFGTLIEVFMSRDPQKKYAIVKYETTSEAKLAIMKMNRTEPLRLSIAIAKKTKRNDRRETRQTEPNYDVYNEDRYDNASVSSRTRNIRKEDASNGGSVVEDNYPLEDTVLTEPLDASLDLKLESLKLEQLKLREEQLQCKHRILMIQQAELAEKRQASQPASSNRCVLPDGRILVRNVNERVLEGRDGDVGYSAGAGDSTEDMSYSGKRKRKRPCQCCVANDSFASSTCTLCFEDQTDLKDNLRPTKVSKTCSSKITYNKGTMTSEFVGETYKESNNTNENVGVERDDSDAVCELKFSDINTGSDDEDETNRLITLRNADYMNIVDNNLKLVVAREGYPKLKMRLQQLQLFQKCLTEVIDMQVKNGLLKRGPTFVDYYLNRGAIVCICKDDDTRDWIVRISPGLEERMATDLVLLKANLKRLCLAVLKIPTKSWPVTARKVFELLQYFNPTLNTNLWKIYAQKVVDDVEYTYFLIDRVSAEIIRGSSFQNVIDYTQMDFELSGYTEIYYECLLSSMQEDLRSVSSRVKLLEEIRSGEPTPRNESVVSNTTANGMSRNKQKVGIDNDNNDLEYLENADENDAGKEDVKREMESFQQGTLTKLEDAKCISDNEAVAVCSDEAKTLPNDYKAGNTDQIKCADNCIVEENIKCTSTSDIADSYKTIMNESLADSINSIFNSSNFDINSNRGIAYYRRTNYLHIDNYLKVSITLEGYPQNKIDGTHIRRIKHLFKEYLSKDMKMNRFANLIIPKFQDVYLTNGALVYVCDSIETKDYLTEILPKLINSTGLKLAFRDLNSLVRYTRVIMQLPKEHAHVASADLLRSLQLQYPGLKPECWKHYSDVARKQKRQFGVDPESLDVIKNPNFNPMYEGEVLSFRIIDRHKRDVSFEVSEPNEEEYCTESKQRKEVIAKSMYIPLNQEIVKTSLKKIRANHYMDLIADDFKLYVGPVNYPETRIDEALFHTIKRTFENLVCDCIEKGDIRKEDVPKFYDIYLFDGVVFIISKDMSSRLWVERNVANVNDKLNLQLKSTEFKGAVGIVNMVIKTSKNTDEVLEILQAQNPRLRTKFWRKTSVAKSKSTLDVVLQIDKASAQVITSPKFNRLVEGNAVEFNLGHLQSLVKPKASLEELTKTHVKKMEKRNKKVAMQNENKRDEISAEDGNSNLGIKSNQVNTAFEENDRKIAIREEQYIYKSKTDKCDFETEKLTELAVIHPANIKTYLEIPVKILPDRENCLYIIFNLLEYKNPGLNTAPWKVSRETDYPGDGKFILYIDKQSLYIIESRNFNPTIGGEILRFSF